MDVKDQRGRRTSEGRFSPAGGYNATRHSSLITEVAGITDTHAFISYGHNGDDHRRQGVPHLPSILSGKIVSRPHAGFPMDCENSLVANDTPERS